MRSIHRLTIVSVVCVALLATSQPTHAYYDDIHYGLTYFIARLVGFTQEQAYRAASATVAVDWDPDTEPVMGGEWYLGAIPKAGYVVRAVASVIQAPITHVPRWRFHAFRNELAVADVVGSEPGAAKADDLIVEQQQALWTKATELGNLGVFMHFFQDEVPHAKYGSGGGHWPIVKASDTERAERHHLPIGGSTDWLSFRSAAENALLVEQTADALKDFMRIVSPTQQPRDLDRAAVAFLVQALRTVNPAPVPLSGDSIDVLKDAETLEGVYGVMTKEAAVGHFGNRKNLSPEEVNNILRQRAGPTFLMALEKINEALERAGIRSDASMPFEKIPAESKIYDYDGLGSLRSPRDAFVLSGALTITVVDKNPRRTLNAPFVPGQLGPTTGSDSSRVPPGGVAPPRQVKVVVRMAKSRVTDDEYVLGEAAMVPGGQPVVFPKLPVGELLVEVVGTDDAILSARQRNYLLREQSSTTITIDSTATAIEACAPLIARAKALAERGDAAGAQVIYDQILRQCGGLSSSVDQSILDLQRAIARARTDAATAQALQTCNPLIAQATALAQKGDPAAAQPIYDQVVRQCGGVSSLNQSIRNLRQLIDTELAGILGRIELAWQSCSLEAALSLVDELQRAFPNHPTLGTWTSSNLARLRQDRQQQVNVSPIIREGEAAMRANDLDTAVAKLRQAHPNAPACVRSRIDALLTDLEQRQQVIRAAREAATAARAAAQRAQARATQLKDRRRELTVNGSQSVRQLEQAEALNRTADAALNRVESGMSVFAPGSGSACAEATSLQARLQASRTETAAKLAELTSLIGQARRDASSCQSPAGAADIRHKLTQAGELQDQMNRTVDAATQMKTRLSQILPQLTRDANADTRLAGSREALNQARDAIEAAVKAGSESSDLAKRSANGWTDLEQAVRDLLAEIEQTERNFNGVSWPDWVVDLRRDSTLGVKKEFETARAMAKSVLEPPLASQAGSREFLNRVAAGAELTETLRLRYNASRQRLGTLDCNVDLSGNDPLNDILGAVNRGKTEIANSLDLSKVAATCGAPSASASTGTAAGTTAGGSGSGQRDPSTATQPRHPLPPEIPPGGGGAPLPGVTGGVQFTPAPPPRLMASLDCGPILELVPGQNSKSCHIIVTGWRSDTTTPVEILIDPLVGGVQASPGDTAQAGDTMYAAGVSDRSNQYVFSEGFSAPRGAAASSQTIMITVRQRGNTLVQLPLTLNVIPVGAPAGITISPPAPNVPGTGGPFCVWQYKLTGDRPECWNFVGAVCTSTRYAGRPEYVQVGNSMTWGQADARIGQLSSYFNDQYGCRGSITRPPTPPAPPAVVTQGNGGIYSVWRYKLFGDAPQCFHFVAAPNGKFGPPSYELVGANMRQSEADARIGELSRYFDDQMGCRAATTIQPPPPPPPTTTTQQQPPPQPPVPPAPPIAPPADVPLGPAVRGLSRFGIVPANITVNIGDQVQLRALGVYTDAPTTVVDLSPNVRWGGDKPQSFTTSAADAGRTFTVTATAMDGSTTSATVTVSNVTSPGTQQPPPTTTTSNQQPGGNVPSLFGGSTTRTDPGTIASGGRGTPLNAPPPAPATPPRPPSPPPATTSVPTAPPTSTTPAAGGGPGTPPKFCGFDCGLEGTWSVSGGQHSATVVLRKVDQAAGLAAHKELFGRTVGGGSGRCQNATDKFYVGDITFATPVPFSGGGSVSQAPVLACGSNIIDGWFGAPDDRKRVRFQISVSDKEAEGDWEGVSMPTLLRSRMKWLRR